MGGFFRRLRFFARFDFSFYPRLSSYFFFSSSLSRIGRRGKWGDLLEHPAHFLVIWYFFVPARWLSRLFPLVHTWQDVVPFHPASFSLSLSLMPLSISLCQQLLRVPVEQADGDAAGGATSAGHKPTERAPQRQQHDKRAIACHRESFL